MLRTNYRILKKLPVMLCVPLLSALVLLSALALRCAAAETAYSRYFVPEAKMYLSVPEDWYVFRTDMDKDDAVLAALGLSYDDAQDLLVQYGAALDAFSPSFTGEVMVVVQPSELKTLKGLSDREMRQLVEGAKEAFAENDVEFLSYELTEQAGSRFVVVNADRDVDGTSDHLIELLTIRNGKSVTVTLHAYRLASEGAQSAQSAQDAAEQEALVKTLLESISFTDTDAAVNVSRSSDSPLLSRVVRAGLTGAIVGGVGALVKSRKKKKAAAAAAESAGTETPETVEAPAAQTVYAPPAEVAPAAPKRLCKRCGKPLPDYRIYCPYCGTENREEGQG